MGSPPSISGPEFEKMAYRRKHPEIVVGAIALLGGGALRVDLGRPDPKGDQPRLFAGELRVERIQIEQRAA
jgi:hypothetical protein